MKGIVIVIFGIVSAGAGFAQTAPSGADLGKLNWLAGEWTRTNAKPGRSAVERWKIVSDGSMEGIEVNLKGADTTFVEKIKLITKDNQLFYVADVKENKAPVYFKLTEATSTAFTCENPQHDFPKKITYRLDGKNLKATISGNGKEMDYLFTKK